MDDYLNKSGVSGVIGYEIGDDFIKVQFKKNNCVYLYNYQLPGVKHVEIMKKRALDGIGLATYINKYVHEKFYSKD